MKRKCYVGLNLWQDWTDWDNSGTLFEAEETAFEPRVSLKAYRAVGSFIYTGGSNGPEYRAEYIRWAAT